MIYLDVTSACQSPLNTGVKRIQRGWHGYLRGRPDYLPVCWQSARRCYRRLKASDYARLEERSPQEIKGFELYDSFVPGLIPDWLHFRSDAELQMEWPGKLRREDVVLLPDLLWDNRGTWWKKTGRLAARRVGVFHDAIALRQPRQSRIDRYFCARGIRALGELDAVICISREAENDLQFYWRQFGVPPVPTRVIPWPVPFSGAPVSAPADFAGRKILYVARLEPHKNHLRLLEACEKLWAEGLVYELRLVGCLAYPAAAREILRRVRALQAAGRSITWQAHVSEGELHRAYEAASFTVFPSLLEGFGLPVMESLWHGRPVVCGTGGALGEVASGGGCEPVDPTEVDSLARGMRHLLTREARYVQLCAEIRERAFRNWGDYWNDVSAWLAE